MVTSPEHLPSLLALLPLCPSITSIGIMDLPRVDQGEASGKVPEKWVPPVSDRDSASEEVSQEGDADKGGGEGGGSRGSKEGGGFTTRIRDDDVFQVMLPARFQGAASNLKQGWWFMEELELAGKEEALPQELSRGRKQKLVIACGLLHDPSVLVFDEPLTGIDPGGIRRMKQTIVRRAKAGSAEAASQS